MTNAVDEQYHYEAYRKGLCGYVIRLNCKNHDEAVRVLEEEARRLQVRGVTVDDAGKPLILKIRQRRIIYQGGYPCTGGATSAVWAYTPQKNGTLQQIDLEPSVEP